MMTLDFLKVFFHFTKPKYDIKDIGNLLQNRKKFEDFVYTPIKDAISELKRRRLDKDLTKKIYQSLGCDIPTQITDHSIKAVIFRQITTPNHELRKFLKTIEEYKELTPSFAEYRDDKFTSNNEYKHSWGNILFCDEPNSGLQHLKIIDLVDSDGKKISDVKTLWGQSLVEFHHELFDKTYRSVNSGYFWDISSWLKDHGGLAKNYYKPVMLWFIQNAILFENFMPNGSKEMSFTRDIFLPSFIGVCKELGHKPLIVNLLPTVVESDRFWLSHPLITKKYIENKISK